MKFIVEIDCNNEAFTEGELSRFYETARILRDTAKRVERGSPEGFEFDTNGNKVGHFYFDKSR